MATKEKPGFPLNRGDGIGDPFAIKRQTAGALPAHCESRDSVQDLLFPREATAMKFAEPSNAPVPRRQPERTALLPPAPKTPLRTPSHGSGEDHCGYLPQQTPPGSASSSCPRRGSPQTKLAKSSKRPSCSSEHTKLAKASHAAVCRISARVWIATCTPGIRLDVQWSTPLRPVTSLSKGKQCCYFGSIP